MTRLRLPIPHYTYIDNLTINLLMKAQPIFTRINNNISINLLERLSTLRILFGYSLLYLASFLRKYSYFNSIPDVR